jgi:hypothetical protein
MSPVMKYSQSRRSQRGVGMIEMLLMITVVLFITGAIAVMYRNADKNKMITGFLVEQMQIEQSIRDLYKAEMDYSGLTFSQIYQSGMIPPDLQFPGSNFRGKLPWGSQWSIFQATSTPTSLDSGAAIGFNILIPDRATCIVVGRQLAPRSLWMQEVTGSSVITLPPTAAAPRDISELNTAVDAACAAAFTGAGSQAFFQYATI